MQTFLMMMIRHALTTGAGALATHGVIAGSDVEIVTSATVALIGVGLSAVDKLKRAKA